MEQRVAALRVSNCQHPRRVCIAVIVLKLSRKSTLDWLFGARVGK
jgi:hypothetical protein